jgi:hypothetical protein
MKNLASVSPRQPSLGPAKIKVLEALSEDDRRDALLKLGIAGLNQSRDDWVRIGREALDRKAQLQNGRDDFYAVTESHDERRSYDNKILDAAGDIQQADIIVEKIDRYLAITESAAVGTALVARAEELCKKSEASEAFSQLPGALRTVAALVAKIDQGNGEASAINPHLPDGCEHIPILDLRITHLPGQSSMMRLLTSQLSTLSACFQQPITVNPPGPAAYPEPVKAALAKLEERRREQIAAARMRPHHAGPSLQRTVFTTTPDPQPET